MIDHRTHFGEAGATDSASGPATGSRSSHPADDARTYLCLDTNRVGRGLLAVAAVLVVVGALANVVIYQIAASPEADIARVMARLDLGHEPSLPAWFSSAVLLLNGAVLLMIGRAKRRHAEAFAVHWLVLGLIFVGLSIDESIMVHEMIDTSVSRVIPSSGFLLFPWVILGFLFSVVVFIAYLKFLMALPRRIGALFIISGALYVGGAVGMEMISARIIDEFGVMSLFHTMSQTLEEGLEMIGAILFLYSLLEYWQFRYGIMRVPIPDASVAGTAGAPRGRFNP